VISDGDSEEDAAVSAKILEQDERINSAKGQWIHKLAAL